MALKIYFAGSIRAGREDAALYARLVGHLKVYGTILTEHVGNDSMLASGTPAIHMYLLFRHLYP